MGNAGDSRAIVAFEEDGKFKVKELSDDQKPDRPDERARILGEMSWLDLCHDARARGMHIPVLMILLKPCCVVRSPKSEQEQHLSVMTAGISLYSFTSLKISRVTIFWCFHLAILFVPPAANFLRRHPF